MRQISAGIFNVLNSTANDKMPVTEFLSKVSKSDENIEANLSTIFQSVCGIKQYWFHRSNELKCMLREWGLPTLFLTFSCAEYDNVHIARYLRKVNDDHSDSYPVSKLCTEDPISMSRKFSSNFHDLFNTAILKESVLGVEHFFWKKEYQMWGDHIIMSFYGLKEHL